METNKFLQPGERRAAAVEDLFGRIASRYDLINDLQSLGLHRRWKRAMVKMAELRAGGRVLDLCCGTGDVAFALQEKNLEVVGLDFSGSMLEKARERAKKRPISSGKPVQFIQGDALRIPFPDESFDAVTIAYGLRNLADWERGLEEMWRVARPGAPLLVLDFGKPDNRFWRGIYFGYLKYVVPIFGKFFCKDAATYAYIHDSLQKYPAQRGVAEKMRALKCRDVKVRNILGGAMSINLGVK